MAKFQEAIKRRYTNIFVCKKCKTKKRVHYSKILAKKVTCRRCGGRSFRPIKKTASK